MKKLKMLLILILAATVFGACHSGNSTTNGKDTGQYTSQITKDTSKADTSKVAPVTGDASVLDNSGSGGTKTTKDSSKMKKDTSKK